LLPSRKGRARQKSLLPPAAGLSQETIGPPLVPDSPTMRLLFWDPDLWAGAGESAMIEVVRSAAGMTKGPSASSFCDRDIHQTIIILLTFLNYCV
jgi:hypothetical protein